jgi:hypothetical protein
MSKWGGHGESLIFLISQPRAGSTLLQKILGSHSDIHTVSEPWVALHPLFGMRERGVATDYGARQALIGLKDFLSQIPGGEREYWEAVRLMLARLYRSALAPSGKSRFLDKTPRYYHILPELRLVFPRAKFIFLLRNPLAVLASAIEAWAPDDCPECLRPFRHDLAAAPALIATALNQACAIVRYEDLAANAAPVVARLCERIGVSFEPEMIAYGGSNAGRAIYRYGDTGTVYRESRPIPGRIDRWKRTLRSPVRKAWAHGCLASIGRETITALGYDFDEMARLFPARPGFEGAWTEIIRADGGVPRSVTA